MVYSKRAAPALEPSRIDMEAGTPVVNGIQEEETMGYSTSASSGSCSADHQVHRVMGWMNG